MNDVFLSYSSRDLAAAEEIDLALRAASITTWFAPRDVGSGSSFAAEIMAAIRDTTVVVVLVTAGANTSPHVARELAIAVTHDKDILPIRVILTAPSDTIAYFLQIVQWFDVTLPLSGALDDIVGQVRNRLRTGRSPRCRTGFRVTAEELMRQRDAVHHGHVHAERNMIHARAPAGEQPTLVVGLRRRAVLLSGRLGVTVDLSLFDAESLDSAQPMAEFVHRVNRSCDGTRLELDSMLGRPVAAAFELAYRVTGSVLHLYDINSASREATFQEWRTLAAQGVELPASALDDLIEQAGRATGVAQFRERVLDHYEKRMIFEVSFARYRGNVWRMAGAVALTVQLHAKGADELAGKKLHEAETYARALGTRLPRLPDRRGGQAEDDAVAIHQLLELVNDFGRDLDTLYGRRFRAVLEAGVKMELLLMLYHPDEEAAGLGLAAAEAVEQSLGRAGIPPDLWTHLLDDVRGHAEFATVKADVWKVRGAVDEYLGSLQAADRT